MELSNIPSELLNYICSLLSVKDGLKLICSNKIIAEKILDCNCKKLLEENIILKVCNSEADMIYKILSKGNVKQYINGISNIRFYWHIYNNNCNSKNILITFDEIKYIDSNIDNLDNIIDLQLCKNICDVSM